MRIDRKKMRSFRCDEPQKFSGSSQRKTNRLVRKRIAKSAKAALRREIRTEVKRHENGRD